MDPRDRKVPLICVSGRSAVGKTAIVAGSGMRRLVTYTSRPRRPGEEDGDSYHFRTTEWFEENRGRFTCDLVKFGEMYYGAADDDLAKAEVVVMTFDKALELRCMGVPVVLVWVEGETRGFRGCERGKDDDRLEQLFRDNRNEVDLVLMNDGTIEKASASLASLRGFFA